MSCDVKQITIAVFLRHSSFKCDLVYPKARHVEIVSSILFVFAYMNVIIRSVIQCVVNSSSWPFWFDSEAKAVYKMAMSVRRSVCVNNLHKLLRLGPLLEKCCDKSYNLHM